MAEQKQTPTQAAVKTAPKAVAAKEVAVQKGPKKGVKSQAKRSASQAAADVAAADAIAPAGQNRPVIQYPIATEKAVSGIETRNEITLIVSMNATKKQVMLEAEKLFAFKVRKVRTAIYNGRKKAIVKFVKPGAASDVASKLKIV